MKYISIIILLLAFAASLAAHPASNIALNYDAKTQLLTVSFEHSVKNPADHFINNVTIKIGGKEVISQTLSSQEMASGGSLVYKLHRLAPGTQIEAVSNCNKMGKKSAKLTLK